MAELAEQRGVSMTEIALAWLLSKVSAPIVGATNSSQIEGAARAVELELMEAETAIWKNSINRIAWSASWRTTADVDRKSAALNKHGHGSQTVQPVRKQAGL